jgi:hypothetical protein
VNGLQEYFHLLKQHDIAHDIRDDDFFNNYPGLYADEGFAKFLIGHSTAFMLQNPSIEGRSSDYIEPPRMYDFDHGAHPSIHIPGSKGHDIGPESRYFASYSRYTERLMTERGLVRIIKKHVECECLEELGCRDCQTKWLALGVVSDVGR